MWLYGFFAPIAGYLFPELQPKVGSTPWSGQRAATRELWPTTLPADFTADLNLLLHWNREALRLRPVLADDWVNPQRPKPDLMAKELEVLISWAAKDGRLSKDAEVTAIRHWYDNTHRRMAEYQPDHDQPQDFERSLLADSIAELRRQLASSAS